MLKLLPKDFRYIKSEILLCKKLSVFELNQERLFMGRPSLYILSDADGEYSVKEFPDLFQIQTGLAHLCDLVKVPCDHITSDQTKAFCQKRTSDEGGVFFFDTGKNPARDEGVAIPSFLADVIIDRVFDQIKISEIQSEEEFERTIQDRLKVKQIYLCRRGIYYLFLL